MPWKTYKVLVEIPIASRVPLRQTVLQNEVADVLHQHLEGQLGILASGMGKPVAKDPRRVFMAARTAARHSLEKATTHRLSGTVGNQQVEK